MQNMDFWFFWNIFKKRWNIIIFVAFTVAIVTGVVSKIFVTPVYKSTVGLYFGRVKENSALEKAAAMQKAVGLGSGGLGDIGQELSFGSQVTGDYQELINVDMISEAVDDELAKQGKWKKREYEVEANLSDTSRIMRIDIFSDDPNFCQEVANIYARQFIEKVQHLIGVQNAQVVEEPDLNYKPISPNIPKNIVAGFVAGFALSFMLFIALRVLDRTIRTTDDVKNILQVPVIGTVHKDDSKHSISYTGNLKNPMVFNGTKDSENTRTKVAEDFRVFRVNLINNKPKDDKSDGRVIAVTSAQAKEGKTFCTANISAALAEAGYKVLLVDCDTGKRSLQKYMGKPDDKGLMNILSGDEKFDDVVKHNLNNMKMDVLFCGDSDVNSANLMISPKFKELMTGLKQKYDFAFLDVSSHLGTADIVSAGSTADSVLLLVQSGKTESVNAKETVDALKRANLDISGVILNGVEEE